jgi:hypothetical protein
MHHALDAVGDVVHDIHGQVLRGTWVQEEFFLCFVRFLACMSMRNMSRKWLGVAGRVEQQVHASSHHGQCCAWRVDTTEARAVGQSVEPVPQVFYRVPRVDLLQCLHHVPRP